MSQIFEPGEASPMPAPISGQKTDGVGIYIDFYLSQLNHGRRVMRKEAKTAKTVSGMVAPFHENDQGTAAPIIAAPAVAATTHHFSRIE